MEFTTDNGIRFIDRRKELTLEHLYIFANLISNEVVQK